MSTVPFAQQRPVNVPIKVVSILRDLVRRKFRGQVVLHFDGEGLNKLAVNPTAMTPDEMAKFLQLPETPG